MTERRDESMTQRLHGDGLLLLFGLACVLLACAWHERTNTMLWSLALGTFALHDLMARLQRRARTPRAASAACASGAGE